MQYNSMTEINVVKNCVSEKLKKHVRKKQLTAAVHSFTGKSELCGIVFTYIKSRWRKNRSCWSLCRNVTDLQ